MNPGRYFMPNMAINPMLIRNGYNISRGGNFIGRLLQGIKSFDWSKLLNGANKTLNVMNQTIPLIKEAKPIVGNVKSMFKLTRAFGNITQNNNIRQENNVKIEENNNLSNSNSPTFFA